MNQSRRPGHDDVWRLHGACNQTITRDGGPRVLWLLGLFAVVDTSWDPALWFPEKGGGAAARRVCASCPVRFDCLDYAVHAREEFGIWGGVGEQVRRELRATLAGRTAWLWLLGLHAEVSLRPHRRIYLIEVQDQFDRLDEFAASGVMPVGALNTNGAGATHGKASTYARGCRCELCRTAIRESQRRNREARQGNIDAINGGDAA